MNIKKEREFSFYESVVLAMKTGYNNILQSVESDKEVLDNEWKDINWNSIKYGIFKIQKRIFEAEKEGDYRKVNSLCRLLVNDKRSLLYAINLVTKKERSLVRQVTNYSLITLVY